MKKKCSRNIYMLNTKLINVTQHNKQLLWLSSLIDRVICIAIRKKTLLHTYEIEIICFRFLKLTFFTEL